MTIQIAKKDGGCLPLFVPLGLIGTAPGSRLLAKLILHAWKKGAGEGGVPDALPEGPAGWSDGGRPGCPDEETLQRMLRALGGCLRRYPGLVLVEVETAAGDRIKITL